MMELGTMTNLYFVKNAPDKRGFANSIRKTAEFGFQVMDLCMCPVQREESELNLDGEWEKIAYEIRNEAEKCGVRLVQSHLPYPTRRKSPDQYGPEAELNDRFRELFRRCVLVSEIVGVKWAVAHPVVGCEGIPYSTEDGLRYNHKVYDELIDFAVKHNVGIAFENMCNFNNIGTSAHGLCTFIDSFGDPNAVGACWDFGHANRTYPDDQTAALRVIGKRLRATHVDDNFGKDDTHAIPFSGTINWDAVMKTVSEIGYEGPFIFEVNFRNTDDAFRDEKTKYLYKVGQHLLELAK